eukprot:CAMPEP_0170554276 /NCGR_PEP_ID=MMETSP0211-20121228/12142_1 /TAXON_ID=311385 /ORGANISM="Pseudokeronopsis sp., Strain OXSARD2" /LENGTH=62 /DNA_ID=CAMNT_0010863223 /DNA_START=429 /DNA_END=617 /DNA_ORIENTATION=+
MDLYDKKVRAERFKQAYLNSKDHSQERTQQIYDNMINARYNVGASKEFDEAYGSPDEYRFAT